VPSAVADVAAQLEAKAASFIKENRLPGAAVGIVHEDKLVWSKGIGFADVGKKIPADPKTLYRIASITKTFTATAVMQLRDEGRLALDDPAVAYLPELASATSTFGPIEGLTIRRLLSHESGLQSEPPDTDWSGVRYESEAARNLARAADISLTVPPNTQWKYSNLGYQLLGELVARVSGMTYAKYLRTRILAPTDDPDVFVVESGFRESGELVRFRRGKDGRVVSVVAAVATMDRLEPVSSST